MILVGMHTELIGVLLIFFEILEVSKMVNSWSHLKVFTGIKKKNPTKKIFFGGWKIFFLPYDFTVY